MITITEEPSKFDETNWFYNSYDCMITLEVYEALDELLEAAPEHVRQTYADTMGKLAPFNEMSLRGLKVDLAEHQRVKAELENELAKLVDLYNYLCMEAFGKHFNYNSPKQIQSLLYVYLGCHGKTTDKDTLEKLRQRNFYAQPFINFILRARDLSKQVSNFKKPLTSAARMTFNINPAGTKTGRSASRASNFGEGDNIQNQDRRLRRVYIADPGYVLCDVDLEQADSRNVAAICYRLFGATKYLEVCEQSDLHTAVCNMVWIDGKDAKTLEQGRFTRRDLAKRIGHATNYLGSAREVSLRTGVPQTLVGGFQEAYLRTFPEIKRWHEWTWKEIKAKKALTTLFGRRRSFHDRVWEQGVLKEALAYQAQSMTAHEIDMAILTLWKNFPWVQCLAQVHDSVLFQIPEEKLHRLPELLDKMKVKLNLDGRPFHVPLGCEVGYNWGKQSDDNPRGLKEWTLSRDL